jgi:hypothetical protein
MFIYAKFWPLDFDQESEIYDIPSWNLPGRMKKRTSKQRAAMRSMRTPSSPTDRMLMHGASLS